MTWMPPYFGPDREVLGGDSPIIMKVRRTRVRILPVGTDLPIVVVRMPYIHAESAW